MHDAKAGPNRPVGNTATGQHIDAEQQGAASAAAWLSLAWLFQAAARV